MELILRPLLAEYTTFRIGGEATALAACASVGDIREALAYARTNQLPTLPLGGGSNILADDDAMRALFVRPRFLGIETEGSSIIAGAGVPWDEVVHAAVRAGLYGLENLSYIPGEVGGACVQNIGAYGAALSDTLLWVEVYDRKDDSVRTLQSSECRFGYRDSIFKQDPGRFIVMRVAFALAKGGTPNLTYKDLAARFAGSTPSLGEVREAVRTIRADKFPDLTQEGTAGSFFKNPTLKRHAAEALRSRYPGLPVFELPESPLMKVPLAWFLDRRNGVFDFSDLQVGGARLFEKQPLVIAARPGTFARDVRALAQTVSRHVRETLGFSVEPEVCIVRGNAFSSHIE